MKKDKKLEAYSDPFEDDFFKEYDGFDEFDDRECCRDDDEPRISDALIGGLIVTAIFVGAIFVLSAMTFCSVKLVKKSIQLIKN